MAASKSSQAFAINELVSLPIIITDHDEAVENKRRSSSSIGTQDSTQTSSTTDQTTQTNCAQRQNWTTGFTSFTDEIWSRMKGDVKQKLRDACVEVLKRTDGAPVEDKMSWRYDEDARFLD